jgi:hypothetical protein
MNITKESFKNSLQNIAVNLKIGESFYQQTIALNGILPELTKILIYEIFVQNLQDYFIKDDTLFNDIQLLRKYCNELNEFGQVNFK